MRSQSFNPWKRGFVYVVTTKDYLEPLEVSLFTLRQHHAEEKILLYWATSIWEHRPVEMAEMLGVEIMPISMWYYPSPRFLNAPHLVTRIVAWISSPFKSTIYIDADTLIRSDLSELFVRGVKIKVAQIGSRERADKPLVNCGVMSYGTQRDVFLRCLEYAVANKINDQVAFQKLYDPEQVVIVGQEWNLTPKQFHNCDDPKIVHFVGRKWKMPSRFTPLFNIRFGEYQQMLTSWRESQQLEAVAAKPAES